MNLPNFVLVSIIEYRNKMLNMFKIGIATLIFLSKGFALDCTYHIEKVYLNEQILTYYLGFFDSNNEHV